MVAGSNSDRFVGIFRGINPSACTLALGSSQALTEVITSDIPSD